MIEPSGGLFGRKFRNDQRWRPSRTTTRAAAAPFAGGRGRACTRAASRRRARSRAGRRGPAPGRPAARRPPGCAATPAARRWPAAAAGIAQHVVDLAHPQALPGGHAAPKHPPRHRGAGAIRDGELVDDLAQRRVGQREHLALRRCAGDQQTARLQRGQHRGAAGGASVPRAGPRSAAVTPDGAPAASRARRAGRPPARGAHVGQPGVGRARRLPLRRYRRSAPSRRSTIARTVSCTSNARSAPPRTARPRRRRPSLLRTGCRSAPRPSPGCRQPGARPAGAGSSTCGPPARAPIGGVDRLEPGERRLVDRQDQAGARPPFLEDPRRHLEDRVEPDRRRARLGQDLLELIEDQRPRPP